jgi:Ca-activated chloride channel family protein
MNKKTKWLIGLLVMGAFMFSAGTIYAQNGDDLTLSPYFYIENGDPSVDHFPLKATEVVVDISGVIADVRITQKYSNDGIRPIHARYIFPASTRAAVHGMIMTVGEQKIKAEIKERQVAQKKFDQAKAEGKNTSLLKQQRPNVFSMNVANIMPGDSISVDLHYTEMLIPTDGTYQFVYPTVVGPRFSTQPEADAPETDKWIENPYLSQDNSPPTKFDIGITLSTPIALQEIVCPSHEVDIFWENESVAAVGLTDPDTFSGDRDFILNFRLAGKMIQSGLMLVEGEDENFFLLMVQPPERIERADIPPRDESYSRTMIVVTDGYIGAEREIFEEIQSNLNRTNVFSFGIGSGVNRYLIEGMAKAGLGEPFVVTKPQEASAVARRFRHYIQSPVLTNIMVNYSGFETYDVEPAGIPDLFAERPVIVFGKWRGELQGAIELSGSNGNGEYVDVFDVSQTRRIEPISW